AGWQLVEQLLDGGEMGLQREQLRLLGENQRLRGGRSLGPNLGRQWWRKFHTRRYTSTPEAMQLPLSLSRAVNGYVHSAESVDGCAVDALHVRVDADIHDVRQDVVVLLDLVEKAIVVIRGAGGLPGHVRGDDLRSLPQERP